MCRIHISLFFLNWSKCTAGHANSVRFWPDRICTQAIWVSVNLFTDTRWRFIWRSRITAVSRELCAQSSIAIKTTSLGITWSEDENKMPSDHFWRRQNLQRFIHIINKLCSKNPSFSTQNKITPLLCARDTVTELCVLCWTVFIYCELFKSW